MADLSNAEISVEGEHIYYCTTHQARQLDNPALVDRCRAWVVMEHNSRNEAAPCLFVDAVIGGSDG